MDLDLDEEDDWDDGAINRTYVIFQLADEHYAVPIGCVGEIVRVPPIVAVPDLPPYISGAANLRGNVVPVVDVRRHFGLPAIERDSRQVLIVVEHAGDSVALLVDAVRDATEIRDEQIDVGLRGEAATDTGCVKGLARRADGKIDIVLDLPNMMAQVRGPADPEKAHDPVAR